MDLGLQDKTVLVLGGGGGLGSAIAYAFAAEGAKIAIGDIDLASVDRVAEEIKTKNASALGLVWDLADLTSIDKHVSTIEKELGPVDVLVNITGGPPPTPAAGQSPDLWIKHFQGMVLSVIAITESRTAEYEDAPLGAHHYQYFFWSNCANSQSRHLQLASSFSGWLVQNTFPRSGG